MWAMMIANGSVMKVKLNKRAFIVVFYFYFKVGLIWVLFMIYLKLDYNFVLNLSNGGMNEWSYDPSSCTI